MDELNARGIEHFNAGRFDEALRCFRRARGPEARVFAAHVLDSAGRGEEAAAEFAAAVRAFPRHLPAYDGLAKLILRGGAPAGGAALLRGVHAIGAAGPAGRRALAETMKLCARAAAACGDERGAEKALRAALRLAPRDAGSRARLAELLRAREAAALARLRRQALARVASGRLGEAERAYRRALSLAPRDPESRKGLGEVLRARARAAASAGELAKADAALRAALAASPGDAELRGELASVAARRALALMTRGRAAAGSAALRRALALRPPAGALLLCAEAWLAGGYPRRAEALLRRVLAAEPANAAARKRLATLLRARAIAHDVPNAPLRRERARRAWEDVVRADPEDGAARISLSLLARWTGGPEEERALLNDAVAPGRALSRGDRFMALMRLGRFAEAVALAEQALDAGMTLADFRAFIDPWEKDNRPDRTAPQTDVAALDAALRGAPGPWRDFYLGSLGGPLEHFDGLPDSPRYRWMNYNAAMEALFRESFERAVRWFDAALREPLVDWRAHGYLAEACLCLDRPARAREEMKRALAAAPANERAQVLAWNGELELWLGGYARALALTTRACAQGAPFAHGWRGAALLKLGKPALALKQLDLALTLYPNDAEARLWRAETKRALGRHREALRELDSVMPEHRVWVLFNRALCKYALGDAAGMKADFESLPAAVAARARAGAGLAAAGALEPAQTARALEAGLRLGRGFRRAEYGQAVWLSRRADEGH